MWKGKVDEQLIEMFLDKIFELLGNSPYDFERYLLDVACGDKDIPRHGDVCDACRSECHEDCEWCDDLEERLKDTITERDEAVTERDEAITERDKAITKYHALKENAILFSPDDLKDILPEYEQRLQGRIWDDDDEIPF
jgi:hypothetical protein